MKMIVFFLAVLLYPFTLIQATTFRSGQDVNIATPVEEDLYVGARSLEINAAVRGDVFAAVQYCSILDTVGGDINIAAQRIDLSAPVLDDARLFAADIRIRADIHGDLIIGSGKVQIDSGVVIHGNLYVGGGSVELQGRVLGTTELATTELELDGILEGETNIRGGKASINGALNGPVRITTDQLVIGEQARFSRDVRYWNEEGPVDFGASLAGNSQAIPDESLRDELDERDWSGPLGIGFVLFSVGRLLAAVLLLLLLLWAFRRFFRRSSERLSENYGKSLGYGLLYILGVPMLIAILLFTIIGIPLGLFTLAVYGFSWGFAHVLAALLGAYWWQTYQGTDWKNSTTVLVAIGIFIAMKLISWVPILGWLISFGAVTLTFGALLLEFFSDRDILEYD